MAITDYKITQGEVDDNKVESAPDVLSDTPSENKKVFDQLVKVFIAKYNDLIDNIDTDFVDSSEFAEGLTVTDKVRWRYALTKGTSIGLNFSGNITQITTGFRTIVGDIDGLTETDFMDCYLSINGTDYECGDSYASGNSIFTSAVINGVTVDIIYDTTNGNITLEHATNPLDTLYWNVSIYRSVAEKVPRKALPASVSNDGYTELMEHGKWHGVELNKNKYLVSETIETTIEVSSLDELIFFDFLPCMGNPILVNQTAITTTPKLVDTSLEASLVVDNSGQAFAIQFSNIGIGTLQADVEIAYYKTPLSSTNLPLITNNTTAYEIDPALLVSSLAIPQTITPTVITANFAVTNTNGVSCIKIGRLCFLRFLGHLQSSLAASNRVTIMDLPVDVIPANGTAVDIGLASGREVTVEEVGGTCVVRVYNTGSSAIGTSTYFGANAVYVTV